VATRLQHLQDFSVDAVAAEKFAVRDLVVEVDHVGGG